MLTIHDKVKRLRNLMKENHVDACLVGTADPHNSEYLAPYYQARAWLTGFTGSAGTAVVTADRALLWADGRYYLQSEKQLEASPFELMKQGSPGVPSPWEWLAQSLGRGKRVAVDGRLLPEAKAREQEEELDRRGIALITGLDLIGMIWEDRPQPPSGPIFHHDIRYTGRHASDKIAGVRARMKEDGADYALYVGLDDIAWLMNFRGSDVPHNVVALAFALITREEAFLFIDPAKVGPKEGEVFQSQGITVLPYDEITAKLQSLHRGHLVTDTRRTGRALIAALPEHVTVQAGRDYPFLMKARLNPVELDCQLAAGLRDSVAVTRYLYFVKSRAAAEGLNEIEVTEKLASLRRESDSFIIESFPTISAYGANAVMMHYQASPEAKSRLQEEGFYLVDCGAQSLDGTTDITRTISLSPPTDQEKRDYTMTLKSHVALASQPFLKGSSGVALDAIARAVMWRYGLDYKCGTGHGFGYVLGVHEGPHRMTNNPKFGDYGFHEDMVITIEPGVYREGKHGIRLENDYLVLPDNQWIEIREGRALLREKEQVLNEAGDTFLHFQSMTYVPFDREAIDVSLLTAGEAGWLNSYNQAVREAVLPWLADDEAAFVLDQTRPL